MRCKEGVLTSLTHVRLSSPSFETPTPLMSEVLKLLWTPRAELRAAHERIRSLSSSPHKLQAPPSPAELPPPPAPEGTCRAERDGEGERGSVENTAVTSVILEAENEEVPF